LRTRRSSNRSASQQQTVTKWCRLRRVKSHLTRCMRAAKVKTKPSDLIQFTILSTWTCFLTCIRSRSANCLKLRAWWTAIQTSPRLAIHKLFLRSDSFQSKKNSLTSLMMLSRAFQLRNCLGLRDHLEGVLIIRRFSLGSLNSSELKAA
jgi:hypothetical protein